MQTAVLSHKGLVREQNEDSYLLLPEASFFAVADGMGGHRAGAFASDLALNTMREIFSKGNNSEDHVHFLLQGVEKANEKIFSTSLLEQDKAGMGTTLTSLWLQGGFAFLAHVGDSRAYLLRNDKLMILTEDHSLVGELVRNGSLTISEAETHPQKHMLTRALGVGFKVKIDIKKINCNSKDLFLLCTDGLTNLVADQEIKEVLGACLTIQDSLKKLLELALQRGGQDNITMLAILME
ncbi:MAG: Stp1/IreP family PP2C-type Ser/Thr phosphatase [Bacillota bacterium]